MAVHDLLTTDTNAESVMLVTHQDKATYCNVGDIIAKCVQSSTSQKPCYPQCRRELLPNMECAKPGSICSFNNLPEELDSAAFARGWGGEVWETLLDCQN
eukprot:3537993-Amphidinium_carterae.3